MKKEKILIFYLAILFCLIKCEDTPPPGDFPCAFKEGNICKVCQNGYVLSAIDGKCYCSDQLSDSTNKYYSINYDTTSDGYGTCVEKEKDDCDFIISGTRECIEGTTCPPNYYQFGKFCFKDRCPMNTQLKTEDTLKKECECSYYIDIRSDIKCLSKDEPCPDSNNYLLDKEKKCYNFGGFDKNSRKVKLISIGGKTHYQFVLNCDDDEFFYPKLFSSETTFYGAVGYCQKECPEGYFSNEDRKCVDCNPAYMESTSDISYKNYKDRTCLKTCGNSLKIYNQDAYTAANQKFDCLNVDSCPSEYPFYYKPEKVCLSDCQKLTAAPFSVGGIIQYSGLSAIDKSKSINVCVTDCSEYGLLTSYSTTNTADRKCVLQCKPSQYKYKNNCFDTDTIAINFFNTIKYCTIDTLQCYENDYCPDDYFKCGDETTKTSPNNKFSICSKNCKECSQGKYIDESNQKCVQCSGSFFKSDGVLNKCVNTCPDDSPYYALGDTRNPKKCYKLEKGCSEGIILSNKSFRYYYENQKNICLEKCEDLHYKDEAENDKTWGQNNERKTDDFICIPGQKCPISHPFEYNKVCYKNGCPDPNMFTYIDSDKINQCTSNCDRESATAPNRYVQDGKCVSKCDKSKFPYEIPNPNGQTTQGYCLRTAQDCYALKYYFFNEEKICLQTCKLSEQCYYIEYQKGNENIPIFREEGTCFKDDKYIYGCPLDFPYLFKDGSNDKAICYKDGCPSGSYEDETSGTIPLVHECIDCPDTKYVDGKKCVSDCKKTTNIFHYSSTGTGNPGTCTSKCKDYEYVGNDNECISTCTEAYYNPDTKQCVNSCNTLTNYPIKPFGDASTSTPLSCLNSCPKDLYYSEEDTECKEKCSVTSTSKKEFSSSSDRHICVTKCKSGEKLNKEKTTCLAIESCPSFYYKTTILSNNLEITVCVETCKGTVDDEPSTDITFRYANPSKQCIENCANFVADGFCVEKCPEEKKFYSDESGVKICSSSCTGDKYHINGEYECKSLDSVNDPKFCPKGKNFIVKGGHTCFDTCPENLPFYQYGTDTLAHIYICDRDCGDKFSMNGKCVDSCELTPTQKTFAFLDKTNKICLGKCPKNAPFYNNVPAESPTPTYYECVSECKNFASPSGECVDDVKKCPVTHNFVGKGKICKEYCDKEKDGKYYKYLAETDDHNYKFYECVDSCQGLIVNKEDGFECLSAGSECPSDFYKSPLGYCHKDCNLDEKYKYSIIDVSNNKVCVESCDSNKPVFYPDKICIAECEKNDDEIYVDNIDEFNTCVPHCHYDTGSIYKFLDTSDNKCKASCPIGAPKYSERNFTCLSSCGKDENYLRPGDICSKSCDKNSTHPFASMDLAGNEDKEIECLDICPSNQVYYESEKICRIECNKTTIQGENGQSVPIIEGTQICEYPCPKTHRYLFWKSDGDDSPTFQVNTCVSNCAVTSKPFTDQINNMCVDECTEDIGKFYVEADKICLTECPTGYYEDGQKCVNKCIYDENGDNTKTKFLAADGKSCIPDCNFELSTAKYYTPPDNKCIEKCMPGYYAEGNQCLRLCKTNTFAIDNMCTNNCDGSKKYYINEFSHGETNIQKECLKDCPLEYRYLQTICDDGNCACFASCKSDQKYIIREPNKISITCTTVCPPSSAADYSDYKFIINDNECVKKCPSNKPYYIDVASNINCYENCPNGKFHEPNSFVCDKEASVCTLIDYDTKTCNGVCNTTFWAKEDPGPKYCLRECNEEFGLLQTENNQCVKKCNVYSNSIPSKDGKKCICPNLYYIGSDGLRNCIDPKFRFCQENTGNYIIHMEGEDKRCLEECNTVLSPDNICLKNLKCPENSDFNPEDADSHRQCKCKYHFYKDLDKKLICLGPDASCPENMKFLNKDTGECLSSCSGIKFSFLNFCYNACPEGTEGTEVTGKTVECNLQKNYYRKSKEEIIFYPETGSDFNCPEEYPYLIITYSTDANRFGECVQKCKDTDNYILFGNKCLANCTEIFGEENSGTGEVIHIPNDPLFNSEIAEYTCQCKNHWYFEKNISKGINCPNSDKACTEYGFDYEVKKSKQCTSECPSNSYLFNKVCYESCSEASKDIKFDLVPDLSLKICKCPGLWRKKKDASGIIQYGEIECLTMDYCKAIVEDTNDYVLLSDTKECFYGNLCPTGYIKFNDICYKSIPLSCPTHTQGDQKIIEDCSCEGLWFEKENLGDSTKKDKYCIDKDIKECPMDYPFLIQKTNQCVKECNSFSLLLFNYTCYEKCPDNTLFDENNCVCDITKGKWETKYENEKSFLYCALDSCPTDKPNYLDDKKECVFSCEERGYKYQYKNVCYNDTVQCPPNTKKKDDSSIECYWRTLDDVTNTEVLIHQVEEDILPLYEQSPLGGLLFEKTFNDNIDTTLHLYGINKKKNLGNERFILKSNLTTINLDSCIEEIYKVNKMDDNDNIIVAKFDVHKKDQENVFNSVEYSFFSEKTGLKIDASICKSGSVSISYPMGFNIRGYPGFNETQKEQLKNLFRVAKNLNKENKDVDLFNYNSLVYHDICVPTEINGKDILIKERRNDLYPNISLCEYNCSIDFVDYEKERTYCKCPIKNEIDLNRKQPLVQQNFTNEETESLQKGPTNFAIIKCLKNMSKDKKNMITENAAFYINMAVIASEVGLVMVSVFYGIKTVTLKMNKKINIQNDSSNENINNNTIDDQKVGDGINENSNPPKKYNLKNPNDNDYSPKRSERRKETGAKDLKNSEEDEDSNKKEVINITRLAPRKGKKNNLDPENNGIDENTGLINTDESLARAIKKEDKILRFPYEQSLRRDKNNPFVIILTEILTRVYLTKTFFLRKKFDIISVLFSLYLLYQIILLTLSAAFFDVNKITKIYTTANFPTLSHYLLYGFISMVITWAVYGLLLNLIRVEDKINALYEIKQNNEDKNDPEFNNLINKKLEGVKKSLKKRMIAFYVIDFIILLFCFFYLVTFCGVFTGTRKYVYTAYAITLIEIAILKVIYGFIVGILRIISINIKVRCLYQFVRILDAYFI